MNDQLPVPVRRKPTDQRTLPHSPAREALYHVETALRGMNNAVREAGLSVRSAMDYLNNPDGPGPVIDVEYREVERG